MKVEVLYFKDCPNHLPTVERVRETLQIMGLADEIREIEVDTYAKAEATAFLGSPSVRINDADIEPSARGAKGIGFSCRTYFDGSTRSGLPSRELISKAISEQMTEPTSVESNGFGSKAKARLTGKSVSEIATTEQYHNPGEPSNVCHGT